MSAYGLYWLPINDFDPLSNTVVVAEAWKSLVRVVEEDTVFSTVNPLCKHFQVLRKPPELKFIYNNRLFVSYTCCKQ